MSRSPARFGALLALAGVIVLAPDTLLIRLSQLEPWTLMGWRGILMGAMSFAIWWFFFTSHPRRDLRTVATWQGIFVILTFSMNSVTFSLGIVETSLEEKTKSAKTAMLYSRANTLLSFPMLLSMVAAQNLY